MPEPLNPLAGDRRERQDQDQGRKESPNPGPSRIERIVDEALRLPDASLVIHRHRTLVEFKTALLTETLSSWQHGRMKSWQICPFEGHHFHLDIDVVERVCFSAEASPCQGGRPNYTVWFETADDAGNPHRPHGYFSVTLNAPYRPDGSRRDEIVGAIHALYRRWADAAEVSADAAFLASLEEAAPTARNPVTSSPGTGDFSKETS